MRPAEALQRIVSPAFRLLSAPFSSLHKFAGIWQALFEPTGRAP
jgi:hypothetical protein